MEELQYPNGGYDIPYIPVQVGCHGYALAACALAGRYYAGGGSIHGGRRSLTEGAERRWLMLYIILIEIQKKIARWQDFVFSSDTHGQTQSFTNSS